MSFRDGLGRAYERKCVTCDGHGEVLPDGRAARGGEVAALDGVGIQCPNLMCREGCDARSRIRDEPLPPVEVKPRAK